MASGANNQIVMPQNVDDGGGDGRTYHYLDILCSNLWPFCLAHGIELRQSGMRVNVSALTSVTSDFVC